MDQSKLGERDKWRKRADYRQRTINRAIELVREYFKPWVDDEEDSEPGFGGEAPAGAGELNASLEPEVVKLRRTISLLRLEIKALRNPHLKQIAPTVIELSKEVDRSVKQSRTDEQGRVYVWYGRLAERLGIGEHTVARHVKKAAEAGLIEKKAERELKRHLDKSTGELGSYFYQCKAWFRLPDGSDLTQQLKRLAEYVAPTTENPKWGGVRVQCPLHPDAPIIVRTQRECGECGMVLDSTSKIEMHESKYEVQDHQNADL